MNRTELIVEKIKSAKVQRRRAVTLWVVLSVFVMLAVAWSLHDIGNTMTIGSLCDKTEHQHSDACFVLCADSPETVLLCSAGQGARGSVAHVHDDFCYDGEGRLICPLEEFRHSHDESCLDEDGVIACGIGFHQHNEDCFGFPNDDQPVRVLVCGTPVHIHDFGCFGATPDKAVIAANYDGEENFGGGSPAIAPFSAGSGESEPVSHVIPFNTEGASNMADYIQSWGIQYYDKVNDKWITVTNGMTDLPANTNYKINIDFYISQLSTITSKKLVLEEKLPDWIAPKDTTFYFNDERAALLQVENGTLLLTFYDDFFSRHTQELSASFYVFGEADWRKINSEGEPVNLKGDVTIKLDFEDDLPEKYGKVSLDKAVEDHITVIDGDSYLKYSLTVTSHEDKFDIRNICVTDSFKRNAGYVSYHGVSGVSAALADSENGAYPFELRPESELPGSVVLSGSDLKWEIGTLSKGSSRTLTYFVKLDNRYVSGASLGDIRNDANVTSGGLPAVKDEDSAVFSPVANLDVSKRIVDKPSIDGTGTGTITYEVSVTAWANNSYTLKNVVVKDHFDQKYKDYINYLNGMEVSVKHKNGTTESLSGSADYSDAQFEYTISEMKPGDTVTLRYTVRLDNLCTAENSNVKLRNDSDVYIKGLNAQLPKDPVKKAFAEHTVEQHSWIRKMYGDEVKSAKTVGISGDVRQYGGETYSNPPDSFTVPAGSRMYQVIINEGGDWDLSSATLADQFQPVRDSGGHDNYYMTYTGFLCIEEFSLSEADKSAIATMDNSAAASRLNELTPSRMIWVDISTRGHDFSIIPKNYGLDTGKYTYMFTYYATPQNMGDVGSIDITNSFVVSGNVGNGTRSVYVPGIMCAVRNTVQGSVFYNYTKYPWYFTSDPGEGGTVGVLDGYYNFKDPGYNGALYWIIKLDGTIKEGLRVNDLLLRLNDNPNNDQTWSNISNADQKFMDDSVVGVYKGLKSADIPSEYSSFAQFNEGYSTEFEKLDGNERNLGVAYDSTNEKFLYREVSVDDGLDGREVALICHNNGTPRAVSNSIHGNGGLVADVVDFNNKNSNKELTIWKFKKDTLSGKYSIECNGQYINMNGSNVTLSATEQFFTIGKETSYENQIYIEESNEFRLKPTNGARFTGEKRSDKPYWIFFYLWEPMNSGEDYQWTFNGALSPLSVTFKHDIALEDDEAVYIVLRTAAWSQLKDVNESKRYRNKVTVKNVKTNVENSSMVIAEYVRHTANKVLKLGKAAYSFDALESEDKKWSVAYVGGDTSRLTKWGEDTNVVIRENGLDLTVKGYLEGLGSGTYAEWYVAANWDGSLSGDVDIIDDLPENFEPVCVVLDDWENAVTSPAFPTIPELDSSSSWELRSHELSVKHGSVKSPQTINYYYDESANKLKWRITGLVAENYDARKNETQNKDHSLGFMVICKVRDPDVILNGTATAVENAVTILSDGVSDRDSDVIVIKGGTSLKKYFELGAIVSEDTNNENTFEIQSAKIPFIIDVNPDGETLSSTGTLPPLIDVLSENLDFIASSVTFKYANGSPVPGCSCSVNGQRVTFTGLPDSVKIRIRYEAKINSFTASKYSDTITNRAYWDGYAPPEKAQIDNTTMNFTVSGSINLTDHPTLKVIKTEKGNDAKFLSGAEFKLMDSTKTTVLAVMTTGADGTAEFFMNGSTYLLNYDTVYYIQEIKEPSGYNIDPVEKCFVILKERSADYFSSYDDVFFWNAKIYGDVCEFKAVNEKIVISVQKSFVGVDNQPILPAAGTYSFGIYADINPLENPNVSPAQVLSITYSDGEAPVYRLGGSVVAKPEFTCAEIGHPYYVFELDQNGKPIAEGKINCSDGGAFETYYTVKGNTSNYVSLSTDYQKINIVNKTASFTLPESGGKGRFGVVFTGIGLIGISVFMLKKRRRF